MPKAVSSAAGSESGIFANNARLQEAIADFQAHGGTFGVAYALLCSAYGKGHEEREGSVRAAHKGSVHDASPSSKVTKVSSTFSGARKDKRKPGHAKRGAGSIAKAQAAVSKSLFDSVMLPDGRRLREVRWSECPGLATRYRSLSRVLMAVYGVGQPMQDTTLDNIVNEDKLREIVEAVERFNDIQ